MPSHKANGKRLNGKGSGWCPKRVRLAIYIRDKFRCQYCGRDLRNANPREVTLDHLKPQCKGGSHEPSNLITACLSCNSRRQHTPWRRYATGGAVERIKRVIRRPLNIALARAILRGTASRAELRHARCR